MMNIQMGIRRDQCFELLEYCYMMNRQMGIRRDQSFEFNDIDSK